MDFVLPRRAVPLRLVSGRGHYDTVIDAVLAAHTSVWIATANLKELMIEDHRARPGVRRSRRTATSYRSIIAALAELADRGVELRILHAEQPSRPFRAELARHQALAAGALALRLCPRVHLKVVVVDGTTLYLGSANWTGAGLGARGSDRRNFELGIVTEDPETLDQVQSLYDHLWRGAPCPTCRLRQDCPTARSATPSPPAPRPAKPRKPTAAAKPRRKRPSRSQKPGPG